MKTDIKKFKKEIRKAIADYMASEGCNCCEGVDHNKHKGILANLLNVPRYGDDSGYDFRKFMEKKK